MISIKRDKADKNKIEGDILSSIGTIMQTEARLQEFNRRIHQIMKLPPKKRKEELLKFFGFE